MELMPPRSNRRFGVFILGAGFSRPACLPLGPELWQEVRARANKISGRGSKFNDDLETYIQFRRDCDGVELTPDDVDFEEFLGFLDVEFVLKLRGSDTWSGDGNETQVMVKTFIGQILAERTPCSPAIPKLYLRFAEGLQPGDVVFTFNYDVLLERALQCVNKPFRLFSERLKNAPSGGYAEVDHSKDEVVILKLHGSIDWFDRRNYRERVENHDSFGLSAPAHPIFNAPGIRAVPLVEGPRFADDPLSEMHRLLDLNEVYRQPPLFLATPWLLAPSSMKVLYSGRLRDFWYGVGSAGRFNHRMAIIGYSMPLHDDYARQTIYRMAKNYQQVYWDEEVLGHRKTDLLLIDFKCTDAERAALKKRYAFLDPKRTIYHFDGFNEEVLPTVFSD